MKNRILSLDIFRGLTIAGMILVNNNGNGDFSYAPLKHAEWHGFTPTDLVFPSFLFIVGVAIRQAFRNYNFTLTPSLRNKIIRRTLLLFLINYFIFYFPFTDFDISKLRYLNVLPRIALSYCFVSFLILQVNAKWLTRINVGILLAYWFILWYFGDPGVPYELATNAIRKLDLFLFGPDHLYHGNGIPFDPEGLLSTLPAFSTCLFGYQVALFLESKREKLSDVLVNLFAWGTVLVLLALAWNFAFPINKKIWSSSFVLICAGLDMMILGLIFHLVDVKGKSFWNNFFLVFGKNAILAYGISEIIAIQMGNFTLPSGDTELGTSDWLYWHVFEPLFGKYNGSLAYAVSFVLVCWSICWVFYKKKIFLKV